MSVVRDARRFDRAELDVCGSELAPAAEPLDEAGKAYARAVTAFAASEPEQGAQALKEAAAFDLEAGELMLRVGADGG